MFKAKKEFLWFKEKDIVSNPEANWISEGLVYEVSEKKEEVKVEEKPKKK